MSTGGSGGFSIGELFVSMTAVDTGLHKSIDAAKNDLDGFKRSMNGAASPGLSQSLLGTASRIRNIGVVSEAAAASARKITLALALIGGSVLGAFASANEAFTKLDSRMEKLGPKIGISQAEMYKMNQALQDNSTASGPAIANMQAMLLTFTSIGKDVFPAASQAILDMAEVMDGDLKAASIQVGKALNDPVKGASALAEVGVTFSKSQMKVIESLQKTGDIAGAQRIILAELSTEFGGASQAASESFAGSLKRLQNQLLAVGAEVGSLLAEFVTPLIGWLQQGVQWFQGLSDSTKRVIVIVAALVGVGAGLVAIFPLIAAGVSALVAGFAALLSPIGLVIAAVLGVGAILVQVFGEGETFGEKMSNVFAAVVEAIKTAVLWCVNWDQAWETVKLAFFQTVDVMQTKLTQFVADGIAIVEYMGDAIAKFLSGDWENITDSPAWAEIKGKDFSAQWAANEKEWDARRKRMFGGEEAGPKGAKQKDFLADMVAEQAKKKIGVEVALSGKAELNDAKSLFAKNLTEALNPDKKDEKTTADNTTELVKQGKATLDESKQANQRLLAALQKIAPAVGS